MPSRSAALPSVQRTSLGRWIEPADAFEALFGDDTNVVWLDSGQDATTGRSYIGRAGRVVTSAEVDSMIEFLRAELAATAVEPAGDGFALGWVGWLGYETRFETMSAPMDVATDVAAANGRHPDSAFMFLDQVIEFDHSSHEVTLVSLRGSRTSADTAVLADVLNRLDRFLSPRSAEPVRVSAPASGRPATAEWRDSDAEYLVKIRECQARIAAGDAYQLCLTTEVHVDVHPDPVVTYLALRESNPSHHGALIRIGGTSVLSSSPEQFLRVSPEGVIESRPIKGTRPRGETPQTDASLAHELAANDKERAENVMIVDLMRNDIGRVSRVGSVSVPRLLEIESYATVHQLVSTVRGELADALEPMDAVVACFPAGSMTGAPKSSATAILAALEGHPRGIYAGAFGYFGLDGRVDLAMTIRTIVLSPSGASVGTGGGITALSDPDDELAEIKLKAAALLRVLGTTSD